MRTRRSRTYRTLETFADATLLEVRLHTGRRNQIRLQARLRGHTLIGERRYVYGPETLRGIAFERQALHAYRLAFRHPVDDRMLVHSKRPVPCRFSGVAGETATRCVNGGRKLDEALEARVVAKRIELRLDAGPRGGEGPKVGERTLEIGERRFGIAAHGVDASRVVARERIVGAEPYTTVEAFERDGEHRARLVNVTELLVRGAEPCVQLDKDAALQRMIGLAEEIDLAREVLDQRRCAGPAAPTDDQPACRHRR